MESRPGEAHDPIEQASVIRRAGDEKVCPRCAETVKAQATACRFCGFDFSPKGFPKAAWIAIIAVLLVLLGGVGFLLVSKDSENETSEEEPSQAIEGSITIPLDVEDIIDYGIDYEAARAGETVPCSGYGGYSDISEGTQVTVKDGEGTLLSTGRVGAGTVPTDGFSCSFPFSVDGIEEAEFYVVEVGRRGDLSYSHAELEADDWTLALSLGE